MTFAQVHRWIYLWLILLSWLNFFFLLREHFCKFAGQVSLKINFWSKKQQHKTLFVSVRQYQNPQKKSWWRTFWGVCLCESEAFPLMSTGGVKEATDHREVRNCHADFCWSLTSAFKPWRRTFPPSFRKDCDGVSWRLAGSCRGCKLNVTKMTRTQAGKPHYCFHSF